MMDLLVSFCNLRTSLPALGLLNPTTLESRVLRLPAELASIKGITGLAADENYVYIGIQAFGLPTTDDTPRPSSLLVLDRSNLGFVNHHVFQLVIEIHSFCLADDTLYCASTGTDEIVAARIRDGLVLSESVFWRPDVSAPREDIHHLNSICAWRGDLYVTGFGRKAAGEPGEQTASWKTARNGFVMNIMKNETLATGIDQPHSLAVLNGELAYCESQRQRLRVLGSTAEAELPGYTRGLCSVGGRIFAATSVGRRVSNSTGNVSNPGYAGERAGRATVSRLMPDSLLCEATADLGLYGYEIYDLLAVDGTEQWPVIPELEWRNVVICELAAALDNFRVLAVRSQMLASDQQAQLKGIQTLTAEQEKKLRAQTEELAQRDALLIETKRALSLERLHRDVQRLVASATPSDAKILVVSKGDEDFVRFEGRQGMHFPQGPNGTPAGHHPKDSEEIILQLDAQRAMGVTFLVIPAEALPWLDEYEGFRRHLGQESEVIINQPEICLIFHLHPSRAGEAATGAVALDR